MHVWTLPQGGTTVSLPNIKNSPPVQDKSTDFMVSLNLLFELLFIRPCPTNMLTFGWIQFYQGFTCKLFIWAHQSPSSVPFLWQGSPKCVFVLHGHITAVKSLSFCSSGLALVSGGIGGLLNIWSLQVRKQYWLTLLCHELASVHRSLHQQWMVPEIIYCILL